MYMYIHMYIPLLQSTIVWQMQRFQSPMHCVHVHVIRCWTSRDPLYRVQDWSPNSAPCVWADQPVCHHCLTPSSIRHDRTPRLTPAQLPETALIWDPLLLSTLIHSGNCSQSQGSYGMSKSQRTTEHKVMYLEKKSKTATHILYMYIWTTTPLAANCYTSHRPRCTVQVHVYSQQASISIL